MSVVIIGGNECMERKYHDLCCDYGCTAKVFTKWKNELSDKIGNPDLLVLFTSTVSHKMVKCAVKKAKDTGAVIERSHSSSMTALKNILEKQVVC